VEAHREEALERANEWQTENRERANANKLAHHYRKLESSPSYQIEKNIRCRIWWALNEAGANKTADTLSLIGCSVEEYWAHLEKQFQPGMTRENYGSYWEIDHIKPCARFDLTDPDQQRVCFHFSNAQPKTVFENRSKGDTWNG
jgi:hypothetical protein